MADKDKKRISFSTEVIILWCALGLMFFAACEFFWWQATGFFEVENAGDQSSQLLILTLGAIGAACGLILAARRSAKFSEQVDTGQKQLFNEQLGRGAILLANDEIIMRQTGIRVLGNLAERTIGEPEQVKLVMQIIHDFVCSKTSSPSKGKDDIALGIRTLGYLYNKLGQKVELKKLVEFLLCHLEGLDLSDAELQGVDFWRAQLQGAYFYYAELQGANLNYAQLQGANFKIAQLQGADFKGANLEWVDCLGVDFSNAENLTKKQVKGMIFNVDAPPKLPDDLEQFLDKRRGYEWKEDPNNESDLNYYFVDSNTEWSGKDVRKWVREYLTSIRDPEDA